MQTFLPDTDFQTIAKMLDTKRLWKQVLEARTILKVLRGELEQKQKKDGTLYTPLEHYPAVAMWRDHDQALLHYYNTLLYEAKHYRGIHTDAELLMMTATPYLPSWFGHPLVHGSHRSNLLRKNWTHYSQFGWTETTDMPYIWPILRSTPSPDYYTCYTRPDLTQQIWILKPEQECAA